MAQVPAVRGGGQGEAAARRCGDSGDQRSGIRRSPERPCRRVRARVVAWQRAHGRHDLPWQNTRDPYRIWLSEIMLQQTQVATVLPYYARFLAAFPDVARARAARRSTRVLAQWSGLGYYRRAHHLHAAAQRGRRRARRRVSARRCDARRRCPASAARPRRRSPRSRSARATRSSTATSSACSRAIAASKAGPARRRSKPRCGRTRDALLPQTRHRGLHAGLDGPRRDGLHALAPRVRRVSGRRRLRGAQRGPHRRAAAPRGRRKSCRSARCACSLIERAGELLFEKRPPLGIWGGLWSLPECALDDDPRAVVRARFGADVGRARRAAADRARLHAFHADAASAAPGRARAGPRAPKRRALAWLARARCARRRAAGADQEAAALAS